MLALRAARADVTQYRVWHNSHTQPFLGRQGIDKLLSIDIEALAEYVDRLNWLYYRTSKLPDWLAMLARLDAAIADRRWLRRLVYFKCLAMSLHDVDEDAIRREFESAGAVPLAETDVHLLQMKVQLHLRSLPFREKIGLLDRVIELSDEPSEILQYQIAKAVQYFLVADATSAADQIAEALADQEENPDDTSSLRLIRARARQMLAVLRGDKHASDASVLTFMEIISLDEWTDEGIASLWREVADARKAFGDWSGAEAAYLKILELDPQPVIRSLLAEAIAEQGRYADAYNILDAVEIQKLGEAEKYDHAIARAVAALRSGEAQNLSDARVGLEGLKTDEPYFERRRLRMIIAVSDAMLKAASGGAESTSPPEKSALDRFNEMVLLRPA